MTSPDPVPLPPGPLAAIVTTEGTTWSATEVTGQALWVAEAVDERELTVEPEDCGAPTMRPPATPPTTRAVPSAAHSSHRGGRREGFGSFTSAPHSGPLKPSAPTRKGHLARRNCRTFRWAGDGQQRRGGRCFTPRP